MQHAVVVRLQSLCVVDIMEAPEQAINILMLQVVGACRDTAGGLLHCIVLDHVQPLNPQSHIPPPDE